MAGCYPAASPLKGLGSRRRAASPGRGPRPVHRHRRGSSQSPRRATVASQVREAADRRREAGDRGPHHEPGHPGLRHEGRRLPVSSTDDVFRPRSCRREERTRSRRAQIPSRSDRAQWRREAVRSARKADCSPSKPVSSRCGAPPLRRRPDLYATGAIPSRRDPLLTATNLDRCARDPAWSA